MISVTLLLSVLAAATALPQFQPQAAPLPPVFTPFQNAAVPVSAAGPALVSRTETVDEFGQYSRSYSLSDGTYVQETGKLVSNDANDGLVLVKTGSFGHPTPDGQFSHTSYLADSAGFHITDSNAVPQQVAPLAPTF